MIKLRRGNCVGCAKGGFQYETIEAAIDGAQRLSITFICALL